MLCKLTILKLPNVTNMRLYLTDKQLYLQVNAAAAAARVDKPYESTGHLNTLDTGERFGDGWRGADRQRTRDLANAARLQPASPPGMALNQHRTPMIIMVLHA
jgi:hypothetical protein